jgi:F420-non-reducing hydrogenase iron-sulfur subunit
LGLEPDRLHLNWISASEGERFANFINDVTAKVKELGPSPLKPAGVK